ALRSCWGSIGGFPGVKDKSKSEHEGNEGERYGHKEILRDLGLSFVTFVFAPGLSRLYSPVCPTNMKILVCMKQVPQKDAPLKLNESGTWIREDVSYEVNEPDAYALEESLRQKEKHTGEVVVITRGPVRAQQVLREALAKGADRAIHLEDDKFVGLDAFNTAKALAAAIKDEKFDLIFTGLQSDDYGYAQTGVILAELLGWPHATIIMQIEKTDSGIRVKRE